MWCSDWLLLSYISILGAAGREDTTSLAQQHGLRIGKGRFARDNEAAMTTKGEMDVGQAESTRVHYTLQPSRSDSPAPFHMGNLGACVFPPTVTAIPRQNTQPPARTPTSLPLLFLVNMHPFINPLSFYIGLCAWVCWAAPLRSADTSPVPSVRFCISLQDHHSGKVTHSSISFNTVCFCECESIQAAREAYRCHQNFTDAFCQVPGSLHNKQRNRLRHFDCSIHHGTNRTYEVGWWRKYRGDRRETYC